MHNKFDWLDEEFYPPEPWEKGRISLYEFLSKNKVIRNVTSHLDRAYPAFPTLSDEDIYYTKNIGHYEDLNIPFAGLECLGMKNPENENNEDLPLLFDALSQAIKTPTITKIVYFYNIINQQSYLPHILEMIDHLSDWTDEDVFILSSIAQWLAQHSPDRNAVKFALLILSLYPFDGDDHIFDIFKHHEDFIPYCHLRLLGKYDYDQINQEHLEQKVLELYKLCNGYGRYYIAFNTCNDDAQFFDLLFSFFMIGPTYSTFNASAEVSYHLATELDLLTLLTSPYLEQQALQSSMHIIKNLFIVESDSAEIFDVPNALQCLDIVYDRVEEFEFNITTIFLLQRMTDFIEDYVSDSDTHAFLEQVGWSVSELKKIHSKAHEIRNRNLKKWQNIVRQNFEEDGFHSSFPRMINHLANKFDMADETGGSRNNAIKFIKRGNIDMADIALYKSENIEEFIYSAQIILEQFPAPVDWNPTKSLLTSEDRKIYLPIYLIIQNIHLFPTSIKCPEVEQAIINGLSSPWIKMRIDTLETILDPIFQPFWTERILSHLENMVLSDPDEDIKNLIQDIFT